MTRSGELVYLAHEKDYYSEVGLGVKQRCVERKRHVALNQADDTCFYCFFWTKTNDLFERWILCNNLLLGGKSVIP